MLMMAGVTLALVAAHTAGGGAGLQHEADDLLVGAGPPRRHGAGRGAHVGTVRVEADALGELLHRLFPQAGVGAGGTSIGAIVTVLDAADQGVVRVALNMGVRADDFLNMHGAFSISRMTGVERAMRAISLLADLLNLKRFEDACLRRSG